ncbi:type I-E CRISPR-associated protein Cas5/CasD [Paeniglutamicibacter cryotolerans]|uniref:CRISPR system Cascade subunit CasD n=1 Tax=Paeniglutamicibacter cryotolerans TaxID=670079 RepID=A0A839QW08_9MICC|nr:type I-E CRISPR-associated protein Cas5/CasD [Paeniglutamicibacter cryotolerans]MBB2997492.1 CRISPR system Cascade subunit CasD [Paeniglutamicibacter cryotolerans]
MTGTSSVLLTLSGPLQSWGADSRFTVRFTRPQPTKSGVIGLVASALGRSRQEPVDDLVGLVFAVRTEQPGTLLEDFQVSLSQDKSKRMPLSRRYYLADAHFTAALSGDPELLVAIADALMVPKYPLFLGRRSCLPDRPIGQRGTDDSPTGLLAGTAVEALNNLPLRSSETYQRRHGKEQKFRLELHADAKPGAPGAELLRDLPVSFDPRHRQYLPRATVRLGDVVIPNPHGQGASKPDLGGILGDHDPMIPMEPAS